MMGYWRNVFWVLIRVQINVVLSNGVWDKRSKSWKRIWHVAGVHRENSYRATLERIM